MATNYNAKLDSTSLTIVKAAIGILVNALSPYRTDVVISRKLFGFFSVNVTVGDILDFLVGTFGTASKSDVSVQPAS